MSTGWLGYDTARVLTLGQRLVAATDELAALVSDAHDELEVGTTVRGVVTALRSEWIPALHRIAANTAMTTWNGAGVAVPTMAVPRPPTGDAEAVARWWSELSSTEQLAVIDLTPAVIGNRDGVPAWARDRANRQRLAGDVERLSAAESRGTLTDAEAAVLANARATTAALADGARFADSRTGTAVAVQLYIYDPAAYGGDGRVAIALGDLDTAQHVAVAVPGMGTEASRIATTVPEVVFTAASAHTAEPVAVMTWHGYDAPSIAVPDGSDDDPVDDVGDWVGETSDLVHVVTMSQATRGASVLAGDVAGLRAMRGADVHLTVIGNSYGSTTVAIAADEFDLDADDVVLTGSPGAGRARDASDLTTGRSNTWVGSASDDPVSYLGRTGGVEPHDLVEITTRAEVGLGNDPAEDDFGARRFQAEWSGRDDEFPWPLAGHGHYFDPCAEAPLNIGAIVVGEYDSVRPAEHRHKDESWDLWDPLGDLLPADPEANEPVDGGVC